jgi:hypothetical protein
MEVIAHHRIATDINGKQLSQVFHALNNPFSAVLSHMDVVNVDYAGAFIDQS